MTTVGELIKKLKGFPEDMPVGVDGDPFMGVKIIQRTWVDNNYPYDRPDFEYSKYRIEYGQKITRQDIRLH